MAPKIHSFQNRIIRKGKQSYKCIIQTTLYNNTINKYIIQATLYNKYINKCIIQATLYNKNIV